jgi:hypothetical protein
MKSEILKNMSYAIGYAAEDAKKNKESITAAYLEHAEELILAIAVAFDQANEKAPDRIEFTHEGDDWVSANYADHLEFRCARLIADQADNVRTIESIKKLYCELSNLLNNK